MAANGRYDTNLQMFIEERRAPDMRRLRFLRWLAEGGRLEHGVAGASGGEFSALLVAEAEVIAVAGGSPETKTPDLKSEFMPRKFKMGGKERGI